MSNKGILADGHIYMWMNIYHHSGRIIYQETLILKHNIKNCNIQLHQLQEG